MKTLGRILLLTVVGLALCYSQGHIGPCGGNGHSSGNCYGYATGRVAGKDSGDATCNAFTLNLDKSVMGYYFNWTPDSTLYGLRVGDVVGFYDHAAYVLEVGSPKDLTKVDHLYSLAQVERNVTLQHVKQLGHGDWIGFWRAKIITATVNTYPSGGQIRIDGSSPGTETPSLIWWTPRSLSVDLRQNLNGVNYLHNYWSIPGSAVYATEVSIYPRSSATYTATYVREYIVTFGNSLPGGESGYLTVRDTLRTAPFVAFVRQDANSISASVPDQNANRLACTFSSWNNGSTSNPRTFSITGDSTYIANFAVVKPLSPPNVSAGGAVDSNVHVTWSEHPSSNVTQYRIWRRVKPPGGSLGDPVLKATLNRGTTSWTDLEYLVTSGYTDAICNYNVESYYSPTQTYSDPEWVGVFARYNQQKRGAQDEKTPRIGLSVGENPFAVGCYPNPFNPSVTIAYQIQKEAAIRLEIYDIMGRKIQSLVDQSKSAGFYTVVWNGQDESGRDVSSGVYLYRFVAAPTDGQKAFMQSGKLMLMR